MQDDLASGFLGMEFLNDDFYKLAFRFVVNLFFLTILVRYIYYKKTERKDYLFTYYMISVIAFMICFALKKLDIDTGMGLGLFAIFGIIRYRTNTVRIKEMTYLFVTIGLSVVNALSGRQVSYAELLFINVATVGMVYIMEFVVLRKPESFKTIIYEKIDNIKPENYNKLIEDLESRTGLKISKAQIGRIDFLKDTAQVKIFFHASQQEEYYPDDYIN